MTAIDHAAFLGHKKITAFLLEQNAETSKKSPVSHAKINVHKINKRYVNGCQEGGAQGAICLKFYNVKGSEKSLDHLFT